MDSSTDCFLVPKLQLRNVPVPEAPASFFGKDFFYDKNGNYAIASPFSAPSAVNDYNKSFWLCVRK